jgi:hypothetical protein
MVVAPSTVYLLENYTEMHGHQNIKNVPEPGQRNRIKF